MPQIDAEQHIICFVAIDRAQWLSIASVGFPFCQLIRHFLHRFDYERVPATHLNTITSFADTQSASPLIPLDYLVFKQPARSVFSSIYGKFHINYPWAQNSHNPNHEAAPIFSA